MNSVLASGTVPAFDHYYEVRLLLPKFLNIYKLPIILVVSSAEDDTDADGDLIFCSHLRPALSA